MNRKIQAAAIVLMSICPRVAMADRMVGPVDRVCGSEGGVASVICKMTLVSVMPPEPNTPDEKFCQDSGDIAYQLNEHRQSHSRVQSAISDVSFSNPGFKGSVSQIARLVYSRIPVATTQKDYELSGLLAYDSAYKQCRKDKGMGPVPDIDAGGPDPQQ